MVTLSLHKSALQETSAVEFDIDSSPYMEQITETFF